MTGIVNVIKNQSLKFRSLVKSTGNVLTPVFIIVILMDYVDIIINMLNLQNCSIVNVVP